MYVIVEIECGVVEGVYQDTPENRKRLFDKYNEDTLDKEERMELYSFLTEGQNWSSGDEEIDLVSMDVIE